MNQQKRVTMYDLADALGISVGTVHRALHDTGRISEETKKRVLDMAEKMHFQINQNAQALRRGTLKIGVLLCCPIPAFCSEIQLGMENAFADLAEFNVVSDMRVMPPCNAEQCAPAIRQTIETFCDGTYHAVVLFLSGPTAMFQCAFDRLDALGIPLVTVVNDISLKNRVLHVAADGFGAGQMAADLLGLCCEGGQIAILTGSDTTYIHHENARGFLHEPIKTPFSHIDMFEHQDDASLIRSQLQEILNGEQPYDGIYITSASVIDAFDMLKELSPDKLPKIVTTDLFKENRYLLDKRIICATIFQSPFQQGKKAISKLYQHLRGEAIDNKILVAPQIVFPSNAPSIPMEDT